MKLHQERQRRLSLQLPAMTVKSAYRQPRIKPPNVEVTGAARLYRAASGGPQGYASVDPYREARKLTDQTFDIRVPNCHPNACQCERLHR
jgi:hypothetical protein